MKLRSHHSPLVMMLFSIKIKADLLLVAIVLLLLSAGALRAQDKIKMSFSSSVQYGIQKNNIAVLVSSDFSGDYSIEGVRAATWKDITKKVSLASGKEPEGSGKLNISKEVSNPAYVAIRYIGEPSAKPTQRGWSIIDLKVSNGNAEFTPGWKIVNDPKNNQGAGWIVGTKKINFRSNQSLIRNESWAIAPVKDK